MSLRSVKTMFVLRLQPKPRVCSKKVAMLVNERKKNPRVGVCSKKVAMMIANEKKRSVGVCCKKVAMLVVKKKRSVGVCRNILAKIFVRARVFVMCWCVRRLSEWDVMMSIRLGARFPGTIANLCVRRNVGSRLLMARRAALQRATK